MGNILTDGLIQWTQSKSEYIELSVIDEECKRLSAMNFLYEPNRNTTEALHRQFAAYWLLAPFTGSTGVTKGTLRVYTDIPKVLHSDLATMPTSWDSSTITASEPLLGDKPVRRFEINKGIIRSKKDLDKLKTTGQVPGSKEPLQENNPYATDLQMPLQVLQYRIVNQPVVDTSTGLQRSTDVTWLKVTFDDAFIATGIPTEQQHDCWICAFDQSPGFYVMHAKHKKGSPEATHGYEKHRTFFEPAWSEAQMAVSQATSYIYCRREQGSYQTSNPA